MFKRKSLYELKSHIRVTCASRYNEGSHALTFYTYQKDSHGDFANQCERIYVMDDFGILYSSLSLTPSLSFYLKWTCLDRRSILSSCTLQNPCVINRETRYKKKAKGLGVISYYLGGKINFPFEEIKYKYSGLVHSLLNYLPFFFHSSWF